MDAEIYNQLQELLADWREEDDLNCQRVPNPNGQNHYEHMKYTSYALGIRYCADMLDSLLNPIVEG